jgi:hypothetical protein
MELVAGQSLHLAELFVLEWIPEAFAFDCGFVPLMGLD